MSGFFQLNPVQVPDFGATLARSQAYGVNALAGLAQLRQLQNQQGRENALAQFLPALAETDPQRRLDALAGIGRYLPEVALPLIQSERDRQEWAGPMPAPAAAPPPAMATPAVDAGPADTSLPRGLRNNNPLNIEAGNFTQNLEGFQGSDGRFARFGTMAQGIAAADNLLQSYAQRGLNTPLAIISRWAPARDGNNVNSYAASVARVMGVAPNQPLDMNDPGVRMKLIDAMARVENGRPLPMDAVPAADGGQPALPQVAGFDMARVQRAMAMPNNPMAKQYLDAYYKAASLLAPAGTLPLSPERFAQQRALAEAGRNNITQQVETRPELSEGAARGTSLAQEGERVRLAAETGAGVIDNVRYIRSLSAETGRLAPAQEALGGWLDAIGVRSNLVRSASTLQAFNAAAASAILGKQMEQRGVQTDGDARRMEQTFAAIRNTMEGNDFIMRAAEAQGLRSMERAEFYQRWRTEPGENGRPRNTLDGAAEAWNRYIRETPMVARAGDAVVFLNEWLPAAEARLGSRDAALQMWRENAGRQR